ncbi:porin [Caldimonas sp. KR1-144]|uniref:porin n=1 Tax=Caldimonas sp. KR1-144 TaxID=3400911 RepID=UPI003BFED931
MMKKTLVALAALSAMAGAAQAQSSVTLYGIVDAAVRVSDNEGVGHDSRVRVIGGGMSQSRWGIRVDEDLGGGLRTLANLENRFTTDDGTQQNGVQFSQAWVGIQSSSWGRITLGRQYNVLFDMMTTTYAPYKFSPYIEAFKPELTVQGAGGAAGLGSRNNNMVKYALTVGGLTAEAQVSAGEGDPALLKSYGAAARYVTGGLGFGGGYIESETVGGLKAKVYQVGVAYTMGPLYVNYSYGKNEFDAGIGAAAISAALFGTALTVPVATNSTTVGERELHTVGMTYNFTPAMLVGFQYYYGKQTAVDGSSNGKVDAFSVLFDYAFSKRTDGYIGADYTKLKDGLVINGTFASPATAASTGATDRTSVMVGLRHRF